MGRARAEVVIDRSADDVWAAIADFSDPSWIAGVEGCRLSGPGERVLTMSGMAFVERQLRHDAERRMVTYSIVESPLRLDHHEASITVTAQDAGALVTWDVDTDDRAVHDLRNGYQRVLELLKADLER